MARGQSGLLIIIVVVVVVEEVTAKGHSNEYILYGEHIHGGAKHFFRGTEGGGKTLFYH